MSEKYHVLGLMSGTSLDGLDIAYCVFHQTKGKWQYSIEEAQTIPYTAAWAKTLSSLENGTALQLAKADTELGKLFGDEAFKCIRKWKIKPDFLASHGHTVFHQPSQGLTFQIGSGAAIAAASRVQTICDFRSLDVAFGGQGAPLVPVGDLRLFEEYKYCINLGGFANISYQKGKKRMAFDICPVNMALNDLAKELNCPFDKGGKIAAKGFLNNRLLEELNELSYYKQSFPKSLGKEWYVEFFLPVLQRTNISVHDKLYTICQHISEQVSRCVNGRNAKMLVTGGGAYNAFLIQKLKAFTGCEIIIPDSKIIEFKEAMIFAFLGVLRKRGECNSLRSVTGAKIDSVGGAIYDPFR